MATSSRETPMDIGGDLDSQNDIPLKSSTQDWKRLFLRPLEQSLTPDDVESAKASARCLLTLLKQCGPNQSFEQLKDYLTLIDQMDTPQSLSENKASVSRMPRRSTQQVTQDLGHATTASKSSGGSDETLAGTTPFPGCFQKANKDNDVEKAGEEYLICEAAESVCAIGTKDSVDTYGTGFRVGDNCIMTAAHVLKEALGIPQEEMQKILDMDINKRSSVYKRYVQKMLNSRGLYAIFTHALPRELEIMFKLMTIRYTDIYLDTAVVELAASGNGESFPPAFTKFLLDYRVRFALIGHEGDLAQRTEYNCYTITKGKEFQRMKRELGGKNIPHEYLKAYDGFGKDPDFLQFHCSLRHGASGSPGVTVHNGEVWVVTMLQAGYPRNPSSIPIDPTLCVEQGVTMSSICENIESTDEQLHKDIFCRD